MGLFSKLQKDKLIATAVKSQTIEAPKKHINARSIKTQIDEISAKVLEHFPDSKAQLITSVDELHTYIDHLIICGICAIDTETTGLDRMKDHIVGWSMYFPDDVEVYIPCKHKVPIFETPYANQLSYEECGQELQRLITAKTKVVWANADFDLAMIWRDFNVDLIDVTFFDVILVWRCLKENEDDNSLKGLYTKYIAKGAIDRMKFSDFFSADLYPYCDPNIAKLYAAADARYTFELYKFEMQYLNKNSPKCKKYKFEAISDLVFGIETPLIKICQMMHRRGVYLEQSVADMLQKKYHKILDDEAMELRAELQNLMDDPSYYTDAKCPFGSANDFNPNSNPHVEWLVYDLLKLDAGTKKRTTKKEVLGLFNVPIIKNILKYRSMVTLIGTFVDKLPKIASSVPDHKIHCEFKSIGADCVTGDTIIPTRRGYYTAKELCHEAEAQPGNLIPTTPFDVISINNTYDSATDIIYYHDTPTIKLTLDYGIQLEGTPNHPIIAALCRPSISDKGTIHYDTTKWTKLEDISVGQYIKIPCNFTGGKNAKKQPTGLFPSTSKNKRMVTLPSTYTAQFAEFLGIYHADGTAYNHDGAYRIKISNNDPDVINRVTYLSQQLFNLKPNIETLKNNPTQVNTTINCTALSSLDNILGHGAKNKRIPKAIWHSPTNVINAYIRGMTLDSSVTYRSDGSLRYVMTVSNNDDASFIQQHLISQGILCSKTRGHLYTATEEQIKHGDVHRAVHLYFNADNYIRFRDTIGFIESAKELSDVPPITKNRYEDIRIGDYFYVKVKSIEHCRADVYDLHVPDTHSFVGNAIICHNTGRFSSQQPKQAYWAV